MNSALLHHGVRDVDLQISSIRVWQHKLLHSTSMSFDHCSDLLTSSCTGRSAYFIAVTPPCCFRARRCLLSCVVLQALFSLCLARKQVGCVHLCCAAGRECALTIWMQVGRGRAGTRLTDHKCCWDVTAVLSGI